VLSHPLVVALLPDICMIDRSNLSYFTQGTEIMSFLGTPYSNGATRAMLLGSGELGKEVAIELQRLGVEVIAVDRYTNAPAMQVAYHIKNK
jgi:lactate dehydrogenase-like 2-hydroxyacid dehydrogenase